MTRICEDSHWVDVETGEVSDELCFDLDDMVEDHDLQHYSVTPPVPSLSTRLRELAKENMVKRNYFLKGHELDLLLKKINMVIRYLESIYLTLRYDRQTTKTENNGRHDSPHAQSTC